MRFSSKLKLLGLTSALVFTMSTSVVAAEKINVSVNGEVVQFDTQPYIDQNGRTMVPIAKIADIFNANSSWNGANSTVTIKDDYTTIQLKIGESKIKVNGKDIAMDTQAVIKGGRTFVPLSAIAKAFDVGYTWNGATNTVAINADSLSKGDVEINNNEYSAQDYSIINISAGNKFAFDGEYLYYSNPKDNKYLYQRNMTTGAVKKLFDGGTLARNIYVTDDYIIFQYMDNTTKKSVLARVNKDGTGLVNGSSVIENNKKLWYVQVYGDKIYYLIDAGNNKPELYSCDLDFQNSKKLLDNVSYFFIADDKIIYQDNMDTYSVNLDLTDKKKLANLGTSEIYTPKNLDLTTSKVYLSAYQKYNKINVIGDDGTLKTVTTKNAADYGTWTILDDKVYYATSKVGISSYDMQTGKETLLMEGSYDYPHIIGDYILTTSGNNVVSYNLKTNEKAILN